MGMDISKVTELVNINNDYSNPLKILTMRFSNQMTVSSKSVKPVTSDVEVTTQVNVVDANGNIVYVKDSNGNVTTTPETTTQTTTKTVTTNPFTITGNTISWVEESSMLYLIDINQYASLTDIISITMYDSVKAGNLSNAPVPSRKDLIG